MEKALKLNSNEEAISLYGSLDENLRYAEKEFRVRISARNQKLTMIGDKSNVERAYRFFADKLMELRQIPLRTISESRASVKPASPTKSEEPRLAGSGDVRFFHRGKFIQGRTKNQEKYLTAIRDNDVVVGIGPAGTGKTYLAMAAAIDFLKKKLIDRIVLTRPAVEAGENLGFLPGDLYEKVNPYLRPLYDALHDMVEYDEAGRLIERGIIEVAPLAYMRGRTLNNAFVILDEGQNTTHTQMKMFLTRLGQGSKAVVTGDVTQIDLPHGKKSGLVEIQTALAGIKGIQLSYLDDTDVVRHPLVQEIIKAYEKHERKHSHHSS